MLKTFRGFRKGYDNTQPEYHRMIPIKKGTQITEDMFFDWVDDDNIRLCAIYGTVGYIWPASSTHKQYYILPKVTLKGNPVL